MHVTVAGSKAARLIMRTRENELDSSVVFVNRSRSSALVLFRRLFDAILNKIEHDRLWKHKSRASLYFKCDDDKRGRYVTRSMTMCDHARSYRRRPRATRERRPGWVERTLRHDRTAELFSSFPLFLPLPSFWLN